MNKEDLIIGVHTSRPDDEDAKGLIKAFHENGVRAFTYDDCIVNNVTPNLTIGFDSAGLPHWQKILNKNIINILWSRDSVFSKNVDIVQQFASFPNFVLFNPTPCDTEPVGSFFPKLKHGYLPIGVNPDFCDHKPVEKEIDIVFCGSIVDIETKMNDLKAKMPEFVYKLMSDIFNISMENPSLSFWQIYTLFRDNIGLKVDVDQFILLFSNLAPLITSHKQVQMLETLKRYNVKVMGNDVWKKYIEGKVEYIGHPDNSVIAKSKIALHYHPVELSLGLHERVLDAAALNTFVISSDTKSVELVFKDSVGYFDGKNYNGLEATVSHYLKNGAQRIAKAEKAYEIVKSQNTLTHRVAEIIKIMD